MIEHGGNIVQLAKKYGFNTSDCIDFSANINPLGISPRLRVTLMESLDELTSYPDIHYQKSHQALAEWHKCKSENILLGNGAVELFYDLARFLRPQKVLTFAPTFMEYEKAFCQVDATVMTLPLKPLLYRLEIAEIISASTDLSTGDVLVICNPNNPTGSLILAEDLKVIANELHKKKAYLLIDEAFIDFLEDNSHYSFLPFLKDYPNVIVVRSLTKFYAIPGLRLGYAVSYFTDCLKEIRENRAPWGVNTLADQAVPVLLADKEFQVRTREWVQAERVYLYQALRNFSQLRVVEPSVNYIFFEYVGQGDLREKLRQEKIFIRSCSNYHFLGEQHYRIAVRNRWENDRLLDILQKIIH